MSLTPSTLANWLKAYKAGKLGEVGNTKRPPTEIEMELARTKRELAETRMELEILKKSSRLLCEGVAARYAQMRAMRVKYPVPTMSRVLEVSASGYYAWCPGWYLPYQAHQEKARHTLKTGEQIQGHDRIEA